MVRLAHKQYLEGSNFVGKYMAKLFKYITQSHFLFEHRQIDYIPYVPVILSVSSFIGPQFPPGKSPDP